MSIPRRKFLQQSVITSLGFSFLAKHTFSAAGTRKGTGAIKLVPDPKGYMDLPEGFSYKIISKAGSQMSDGLLVPGRPDGMGAFQDESGRVVLIRNHENSPVPLENSAFGLQNELLPKVNGTKLYDLGKSVKPGLGGTTTLVYDETKGEVVKEFMSLAGTYRNCAGGVTPWKSWLTCEEDVTKANGSYTWKDHGYVFEVPSSAKSLIAAEPIKAMGRFNHEAVAVDPRTGIIYQTEDRPDGLIYRFIPRKKSKLLAGGKLQVLALKDRKNQDTRNWETIDVRQHEKMEVEWLDIDQVESPEDDLRYRGFEQGAARFARGEGMWMGENELFFACTNGGPGRYGQVFKYTPSVKEGTRRERSRPGSLELFAESPGKSVLHMCDNLTIAPWGDIFICEDNGQLNRVHFINKKGELNLFAINRSSTSEFTGGVFSLTGKTFFVNVQENGDTVAITGPWQSLLGIQ